MEGWLLKLILLVLVWRVDRALVALVLQMLVVGAQTPAVAHEAEVELLHHLVELPHHLTLCCPLSKLILLGVFLRD